MKREREKEKKRKREKERKSSFTVENSYKRRMYRNIGRKGRREEGERGGKKGVGICA